MAKQTKKAKTPVTIRFKKLKNGNESIYLDIYRDGRRTYEFLKLYIVPGKDPLTKIQNENTMTAAMAKQAQRIKEITAASAGLPVEHPESRLPIDQYVDDVIIREKKEQGATYNQMEALRYYLRSYETRPTLLKDITKSWVLGFIAHLRKLEIVRIDKRTGKKLMKPLSDLTISHMYITLGAVLHHAQTHDYIIINPAANIPKSEKPKRKVHERCYLTIDELKRYEQLGDQVKAKEITTYKAFLFSCYTGLRFSDCQSLTWGMIRKGDDGYYIQKRIVKTDTPVQLPLSKKALSIIGIDPDAPESRKANEKVFSLVSSYKACRHINRWTNLLGIDKDVTFHTARHTFATMMLTKGADIYTTSELLCHASISTTQIYAKIVDSKKRNAINLLDQD